MNNTFLQILTVLHYFGELIAVGKTQDMVHETADSILEGANVRLLNHILTNAFVSKTLSVG